MAEHTESARDDRDDTTSNAGSDISTTSTEMFEHEPFDTFQSKVLELCKSQWPHLSKDAFTITRMDGGSYNRVLGVQLDNSWKQTSWFKRQVQEVLRTVCPRAIRKAEIRDYVLRIPRMEHAWVEHEVTILKFLAATSIPVPRIKTFSLSAEDPIGSPYMIQPRLPGESVIEVYLELNTQQRVSFASQLGSALKEMGKIQSPSSGTLNPDNILTRSSDIQLLRLQCPPKNAFRQSTDSSEPSTPQTVYDFFMSQFARQRAYDLTLHREFLNPWKPFTAIIQHIHRLGYLNENIYALTHMDFEPRNILIHVTSPTTASLSAVLDWDETVFAPCFTNCRPPSWLWDFEGDDDEEIDEANANHIPQDADLSAVKKAFEEAAGEEYCKWAYTKEYRLARDIARLAITGFFSNMDYDAAEKVMKEWNEMYPRLKVCGISNFEEDEQ
jgi:aminoglycoside phosphotransferase (APT) family kinase protein